MSEKKECSINSSSLIDLKAELFRKQEEFKRQKLLSQDSSFIKGKTSTSEKKKPNIWSKKNAGVSQRAEKDYETKLEEEDVFEKSRKSLENKAKLYEKISSGNEVPEEDGSGLYLVDFQKKMIDDVFEQRDRARKEEEERQRKEIEEEKQQLQQPVPEPENEEEEWVDFVDSLGRSRRCLKKDLPDLQRQDEELKERKRATVSLVSTDFQRLRDKSEITTNTLMSDDMRREIQREEWERQELETMEAEKSGPIHYSDVRHSEIRTHGVGFYQFDKDETARQEQMQELSNLREQTKTERSKKDRIKEKRKAALEARLAKVKQRRKVKTGDLGEAESENKPDEEIGPKIDEKTETIEDSAPAEVTQNKSTEIETTKKPVPKIREWDRGKEKLLERSESSWLERQRAERFEEFAPPKEYYDSPKPPQQNLSQEKRCSIFTKINSIKLGTKLQEKSDKIPTESVISDNQSSYKQGSNIYQENENLPEADNWNNQTTSQTTDNSEKITPVSEVQNVQLPYGFDPSVPPPIPVMQPSWFPQQQTGTSFSAVAGQGFNLPASQSTNIQTFAQNVTNVVMNPTEQVTIPQNTIETQGVNTNQNIPADNSYMYMTGLPPISQEATFTTTAETQSNFAVPGSIEQYTGSFEQYTSALPTNYSYNVGSIPPENSGSNVTSYGQGPTQTVPSTEKKIVIPKMKILDTRLMQNEND